jgi:hypothetical protein
MTPDKARSLIQTVSAATKRGDVHWKRNASLDGYLAEVEGMTLELRSIEGPNLILGQRSYELEIRNEKSQPVDGLREDQIRGLLAGAPATNPVYGLAGLYDVIEKIGDPIIDKLIEAMKPQGLTRRST